MINNTWGRVREIVGLWRRGVTAEEFFKAAGTAVGLANEKAEPIHRVVSLLGPDGTWLRRRVESWLRQGVKDRTDFKIITVERDENWARDSNPRRDLPTLEVVIRELAQELGEALPPTGDPAQWLHDRLKNAREDSTSAESTRKLLVIDGADRLDSADWQRLVRVLNYLPMSYCIGIATTLASQACGILLPLERAADWGADDLDSTHAWQRLKGRLDDRAELVWERVRKLSRKNARLEEQLLAYLAELKPFDASGHLDKPQPMQGEALANYLMEALACLALPLPVLSDPVSVLNRLSLLQLAGLEPSDRELVRRLAIVQGRVSAKLLSSLAPGLEVRLRIDLAAGEETDPIRALFEYSPADGNDIKWEAHRLFPHVRRAALTSDPEQLADASEENVRNRLLLHARSQLRDDPKPDYNQGVALLVSARRDRLPFHLKEFRSLAIDTVSGLERQRDGATANLAGQLIELLMSDDYGCGTNLDLPARSRLETLTGQMLMRAAEREPSKEYAASRHLWSAYHLAHFSKIHSTMFADRGEHELNDVAAVATLGAVFGSLTQVGLWEKLLVPDYKVTLAKEVVKLVDDSGSNEPTNLWNLMDIQPSSVEQRRSQDKRKPCPEWHALLARVVAFCNYIDPNSFSSVPSPAWFALFSVELALRSNRADRALRGLFDAAALLGRTEKREIDFEIEFEPPGSTDGTMPDWTKSIASWPKTWSAESLWDTARPIVEGSESLPVPVVDPYYKLVGLMLDKNDFQPREVQADCKKRGLRHFAAAIEELPKEQQN